MTTGPTTGRATALRRLFSGLAVLALACTTLAVGAAPAQASAPRYLALGDSVPFGYSPLITQPADPRRYVGYPELVAARTGLRLTNLSCPGQTSGGLLSLQGDDNGCFDFRRVAELHTDYRGSQLAAATTFLRRHPRTAAVTLMIGANDLFRCRNTAPNGCDVNEFQAAIDRYTANLSATLTTLRSVYRGRIVLVSYYSTDYNDQFTTQAIQVLNLWTAWTGGLFGATVADGYMAFQQAAAVAGGDTCAAGLLIRLPTGGCDVHPSHKGARLLARTVVEAIAG